MKKKLLFIAGSLLIIGATIAQEKEIRKEEVIIRKDGNGKEERMTVVVKNDSVFVNGKPVKEGDGNFIIRRKIDGNEDEPLKPQAFLGVNIEKAEKGVRVVSVSEGSNAEKAGLKEGDIIVSLAGKTETDPEAFRNLVRAQKPNEEVKIVYIPAGETKEKKINVKLGSTVTMTKTMRYSMPISPDELNNFDFKSLKGLPEDLGMIVERELGRSNVLIKGRPQLGIKIRDTENNTGVTVLEVEAESLAAKAGVKEKDLLISIDGKDVKDTDAAREALQSVKEKNSYILKVNRDGKTLDLNVQVPKKLKEANL